MKLNTIIEAYRLWHRGKIKVNTRQEALLKAWEAFLRDHTVGDMAMLAEIPDAFDVLWLRAS